MNQGENGQDSKHEGTNVNRARALLPQSVRIIHPPWRAQQRRQAAHAGRTVQRRAQAKRIHLPAPRFVSACRSRLPLHYIKTLLPLRLARLFTLRVTGRGTGPAWPWQRRSRRACADLEPQPHHRPGPSPSAAAARRAVTVTAHCRVAPASPSNLKHWSNESHRLTRMQLMEFSRSAQR